jgi:hypothetical protein
MEEPAKLWETMLEEAKKRASGVVADFISLRSQNDLLRKAGIDWVLDTVIKFATDPRLRPPIEIMREEPHEFFDKSTRLVGQKLQLNQGLRCMILEAGWPRIPSDGFIRGGGLALVKIKHKGFSEKNVTLRLKREGDMLSWSAEKHDIAICAVDEAYLLEHLAQLYV